MQPQSTWLIQNEIVLWLQAGAWPLNLTSLSTFSVPQELEKSVQTVSYMTYKVGVLVWKNFDSLILIHPDQMVVKFILMKRYLIFSLKTSITKISMGVN